MNKKTIVFCHGWGFDHRFWSPILHIFKESKIKLLNFGYFADDTNKKIIEKGESYIGIGHSLGMVKLISFLGDKLHHLVGINSFVNFLGSDPALRKKRASELAQMTQAFRQNPADTLKNFQVRTLGQGKTVPQQYPDGKANFTNLLADLENLALETALPGIPMLILGSTSDKIVPVELLHDNFPHQKVILFDEGGHNLVGSAPTAVYGLIKDFLNL